MAKYTSVIRANRTALLGAFLTERLGNWLDPQYARRGPKKIDAEALDRILEEGAKFADDIGIKNGGMSDGQVESALTKALGQAIAALSAQKREDLASSLKEAFAAPASAATEAQP